MTAHPITISDLKAIACEQNVVIKEGDILLVRTGWTKWYDEHSAEERLDKITNGKEWVGVQGCRESVEWLWDQRFAAVAGDNIGFEVWPTDPDYSELLVVIWC